MPFDDIDDDFFQAGDATAASEGAGTAQPRRMPPRLGLLADLTDEEFDLVARAAKLSFQPEGATVFEQGAEADRFFILVDGAVAVVRDGETLATLGPGAFFGESALLVRGRRSATVTTLADCSLWSVSYAAFDGAVSRHLLADDDSRVEAERRIAETPAGKFDAPEQP
jgi:CRP-like cAMP-binding protein